MSHPNRSAVMVSHYLVSLLCCSFFSSSLVCDVFFTTPSSLVLSGYTLALTTPCTLVSCSLLAPPDTLFSPWLLSTGTLLAPCWHPAGPLLPPWYHPACILLASCWHRAGCWRLAGTCWHPAGTLLVPCQYPTGTLLAPSLSKGTPPAVGTLILALFWQPAGTSLGP